MALRLFQGLLRLLCQKHLRATFKQPATRAAFVRHRKSNIGCTKDRLDIHLRSPNEYAPDADSKAAARRVKAVHLLSVCFALKPDSNYRFLDDYCYCVWKKKRGIKTQHGDYKG